MLKSYFNKPSFIALHQFDFRRFLFSKFVLTLALQIQFVVISWQVFQITHDPFSLGLLGLAEAIPAVGIALYSGYIADRNNRKNILLIVLFSWIIATIVLWYISVQHSSAMTSAFPFYVIMFFIGVGRSFYAPAQFSLMTQLVNRDAYANSGAWNSTFWHIAVVVGSSIGGLLLAYLGIMITYTIITFLFLLAIIQLLLIKVRPFEKILDSEPIVKSIKEGLRFVFSNQVILGALALDMIAVLFGGATAMLPAFAADVLHVGEKGFGFLRAAPFLGAVAMAVFMTKYPPVKLAGKKLLFCVGCFSLCMIAFALSKNFYLSMFILAVSGAFDNVSVVIRSTILQIHTPENMRGRVSSVSTMFISSSNEIGAFESGFAARLFGLVNSVVIGGCIAVGSVFIAAAKLPLLRKLDLRK